VIDYALEFVYIQTPSCLCLALQKAYTSYNFGCRVMWFSFAGCFSGAVSHILSIILFYNILGWGFTGICWATQFTYVVRFSVIACLTHFSGKFPPQKDAQFLSKSSVTGLTPQLKLCMK